MPLEERRRRAWVTNIETGRAVVFVTFEGGRAIKEGANHAESSVPKVGLEPTRVLPHRILSPARLPYSWYWKHVAVMIKGLDFKAITIPPRSVYIAVALG